MAFKFSIHPRLICYKNLAAMWRSAFSVFGITDRDLRSIVANVNMQHYGYQSITTDAGGKTIKSQNPEKIKRIQSIFLYHVITNFVNMADR